MAAIEQQHDIELTRRLRWKPAEEGRRSLTWLEWLVTNGLGGYSTGTISGSLTRRYHGYLVSALPTPFGRVMMFNYLWEQLRYPDGRIVSLTALTAAGSKFELDSSKYLTAFWLQEGLPVWVYDVEGVRIEKRLLMPHLQNTVHVTYRLLSSDAVRLELRPLLAFRLHEAPVNHVVNAPYALQAFGDRFEVAPGEDLPPLRLYLHHGGEKAFTVQPSTLDNIQYPLEQLRGYECGGSLWNPGYFRLRLAPEHPGTLIASYMEIARRLETAPEVVARWRRRVHDERLAGLEDRARSGRPRRFPPGRGRPGEGNRLRAAARARPAPLALLAR